MRRKIVICIITILFLISFSINVFSNNEISNQISNQLLETNSTNEITNATLEEQVQQVQSQIKESSDRLEYVEGELSATLQKVQDLDDSIKQYEEEYNTLNNQVIEIENQIKESEEKIKQTEDEYNRKENLLKKRTVALYEQGDTTYLDVLLKSNSILEFLSNYYLLEQIIEFDNNLLEELEQTKSEIMLEKAKQEKQQEALQMARTNANRMKVLMENNKILQESYILQLSEEEKQLNQQIEEFKQQEADLERQIQEAILQSGGYEVQYTGGMMIWPIAKSGTYITSGYGNRLHPIQGVYKYHSGLDIGNAGFGAPIVAAMDGVVTYASEMGGYGNCVMINHGNGIITLYGHGQDIIAKVGDRVKQGDLIMTVGSTGNSTGPHLHFEVRVNGTTVSPLNYLQSGSSQNQSNLDNTQANNAIVIQ